MWEVVNALLGFWTEELRGFSIGGIIISISVDDIALIAGLPGQEKTMDTILANKDDLNPDADKLCVQLTILYLWGCVMFLIHARIVVRLIEHVNLCEGLKPSNPDALLGMLQFGRGMRSC
ncbi:hypothetical protein AXF42_Ash021668 [Apostasia shenzhenica]|uniref:Uncharacterized protein n=1 Tax=Apostasia shenzhenica TaxID=1088818 RepID=A0A2H9ZSU6_9ASPA|nr:hypothetical protein AXF42_Ash021668 [Apostasia shenzhenica]